METSVVLLVEDNPYIMEINATALAMKGYRVVRAETVQACWEQLRLHNVGVIVLDVLLPDGDGLALCRAIKAQYDVPILFLSALGEKQDIIQGLAAGGDDYLPKPYDLDIFVARVEARLRAGQHIYERKRVGPLEMDLLTGRAYWAGRDLRLTQKEFSVVVYLAKHRGRVVPAEELYEAVWGQPLADDLQSLRMTISRLKQKLGSGEEGEVTISSYRGSGYCLESR